MTRNTAPQRSYPYCSLSCPAQALSPRPSGAVVPRGPGFPEEGPSTQPLPPWPSTKHPHTAVPRGADGGWTSWDGALTSLSPCDGGQFLPFFLAFSGQPCLGLAVKQSLCHKRNHLSVKMKKRTGRSRDKGPSLSHFSVSGLPWVRPGGRSDRMF